MEHDVRDVVRRQQERPAAQRGPGQHQHRAVWRHAQRSQGNADAYRPFQLYGDINVIDHTLYSNYHSWQNLVQPPDGQASASRPRTRSRRRWASAAASRAGSIQPPDLSRHPRLLVRRPRQRSPSHLQRRVQLELLPEVKTGVTNAILGNWQISGITPVRHRRAAAGHRRRRQLPHRRHRRAGRHAQQRRPSPGRTQIPAMPVLTCDPRGSGDVLARAECFAAPSPGQNGNFVWPEHRGPWYMQPRPVAVQELPDRRQQEGRSSGCRRTTSSTTRSGAGRRAEPEPRLRERRPDQRRTSGCCRPTTSTAGASSSWRSSSTSTARARRKVCSAIGL